MKHLSGAPLQGRLLASLTNIRLGWKGMPGTNTLAYYKKSVNYSREKFIEQAPEVEPLAITANIRLDLKAMLGKSFCACSVVSGEEKNVLLV
jgi:hypothetical protein